MVDGDRRNEGNSVILDRLERLVAQLAAADSATRVLEELAASRGWPEPVRAQKRLCAAAAPPEVSRALRLRPGERLAARSVALASGRRVLSLADNWYVASRLPADVNRRLEQTDEPFGLLLLPYRPRRALLRLERLWRPGADPAPAPAAPLFRLAAVMSAACGAFCGRDAPSGDAGAGQAARQPLAFVSETYLADVVDWSASP